tara:strand:- start:1634 stop:2809 length:1176 start_codon:yes stop_codon:yes gene_type:complete
VPLLRAAKQWCSLSTILLLAGACTSSLFDATSESRDSSDSGQQPLDDGGFAPLVDAALFDADPAAPDAQVKACSTIPSAVIGANTGTLSETSSNTLHGSCANGLPEEDGTEDIYQLILEERGDIQLSVAGTTNSPNVIVYVLQDDCGVTANELACGSNPSLVEVRDADAGTYYIVVEGYDADELGGYQLNVKTTALLAQGDTCSANSSDTRCATDLLCAEGTCQSSTELLNIAFTTELAPAIVTDTDNSGPRWNLCSQVSSCFNNETGSASGGNSAIVVDAAFDSADRESLSTPNINATGYSNVVLSFSQYFYEWFACDDAGFIEVTTNGGSSYVNVDTLLEVHKGYAEYDISSTVAGQTFSVRFVYDDNTAGPNCSAQSWQLDDIVIRAL